MFKSSDGVDIEGLNESVTEETILNEKETSENINDTKTEIESLEDLLKCADLH